MQNYYAALRQFDNLGVTHGFWEAKDIRDDLPKEARKKFALGYPRDNIFFQNPRRALLFQNDALVSHSFSRADFLKKLDRLYLAMEQAATTISDFTRAASSTSGRAKNQFLSITLPTPKLARAGDHPPALHADSTARQGGHTPGIQLVLSDLNSLVQRFGRVLIQHRHCLLADDWARVHARIHEMDGAAGHLDSVLQRLPPGFQAGKRRQERRVNVNRPPCESPKEPLLQHPHESRQHHQVHPRSAQRLDVRPLRLLVQFGAELAGRNEACRNLPFACPGQDASLGHVAQHQCHFCRHRSGAAGVRNRHEVRTLARTQHAYAKVTLIRHAAFIQAQGTS